MNKDQFQGQWKILKGQVKQRWGKLTDDDITQINGRREQLLGSIQKRYGIAKERAEEELSQWESQNEMNEPSNFEAHSHQKTSQSQEAFSHQKNPQSQEAYSHQKNPQGSHSQQKNPQGTQHGQQKSPQSQFATTKPSKNKNNP